MDGNNLTCEQLLQLSKGQTRIEVSDAPVRQYIINTCSLYALSQCLAATANSADTLRRLIAGRGHETFLYKTQKQWDNFQDVS